MSPFSRQTGTRSSRRKPRGRPNFLDLKSSALVHFSNIAHQVAYPGGAIIFKEGTSADGIYLVCLGRVKLFATSSDGHRMILKIAGPGDVLGLSATLNALPHEVTAQTLVPCNFKHIGERLFLKFLESHAEAGYLTALTLAKEHREVFLGARRLALSPTASARIAQILIELAVKEAAPRFPMELTHAELANLAGTSRETVTRLLNQFERDGIIARDDSNLTILERSQLEKLAN
ncbi:Crp/Fnr family transcriptional regulator [Terracidiphilus sp.]|uniref:Crp/Fnr family transcriptional regulator n=1 Tax=Terracidiphilus sp. TaxID=1964191 RepID=UPI003C1EFCDA